MAMSVQDVIEEVMRIYRSLPARPRIEEVEAARAVIRDADRKEQVKIDEIEKQQRPAGVPDELFTVLQEMQRNSILMQSKEEKKEAMDILDLERLYNVFDDALQRASDIVSEKQDTEKDYTDKILEVKRLQDDEDLLPLQRFKPDEDSERLSKTRSIRDDSFLDKPTTSVIQKRPLQPDKGFENVTVASFGKPSAVTGDTEGKLSIIKFAKLIEVTANKGSKILDVEEKLLDQVQWLPDSIGKLTELVELNLSNNCIVAIPNSIGELSSLTILNLHSNQLYSLPESIGGLSSLTDLDLHANSLRSVPSSIGDLSNLENLDLSYNQLTLLPDSLGKLQNLKKLNIESNEIEELPYTIGNCFSLTELRADFNHLKALPEAVGKLQSLEVLTFHYNNVRNLPTTMAGLESLRELDTSFNELESIPESLCFATNLVKLNVGRNFANLNSLPRSIGNLEMLEELDISSNQIKVLPESFANLKKLRILRIEEVPLQVPPMHIAQMGAQAVLDYMNDLISKRNENTDVTEQRSWLRKLLSCLMFWKNSSTSKKHQTEM